MRKIHIALIALALAACKKEEPAVTAVYQAVPVVRRDIVVSVQAAGTLQPDTTVEVKSKASGEIAQIMVETGQEVRRGELMVSIDPRTARNTMAQVEARFEVAKATLANARSQKRRSDELFASQSITQTEHEAAQLAYANAVADSVSTGVEVENARIQLEDTDVRAPISGTIIEKNVERGQVISSPTRDVGGGTVLLRMADLSLVQVRTLVDETDVGKIRPGLSATVTVDAYPNRPFEGTVLKIEPLAIVNQNVTMFPVIVRIQNQDGLLRPGMNAEVQIHVGRRDSVLAIPNSALRTTRDVSSAALVLGLDSNVVTQQLAQASRDSAHTTTAGAGSGRPTDSTTKAAGNGQNPPAGRTGGGNRTRSRSSNDYQFGAKYIVFVQRNGQPLAVNVQTGLTDMDYSEVTQGLTERDSVLILPSASLIASQEEWRERMGRVNNTGSMGGLRSTTTPSSTPSAGAPRP